MLVFFFFSTFLLDAVVYSFELEMLFRGSCLSHRFPCWFCQCWNSQSLVEGCTAAPVIRETKDFLSPEQAVLDNIQ